MASAVETGSLISSKLIGQTKDGSGDMPCGRNGLRWQLMKFDVTPKLDHLSHQILQHCRQIDWRARLQHSAAVASQDAPDYLHGKHETGTGGEAAVGILLKNSHVSRGRCLECHGRRVSFACYMRFEFPEKDNTHCTINVPRSECV